MLAAHRVLPQSKSSAPASYNDVILADSPVAFWPLNETSGTTANDATGNGYNGTYTGGYTLGQTGIGDGETSALFDGSSGYVTVPDATALDITGDLTLELWVADLNTGGYEFLITKDVNNGGGANLNPYELRVEPGGSVIDFLQSDGTSNGIVKSSSGVGAGWTYLAATRDGTTANVVFYVNGTAASGGTIAGNPPGMSVGTPLFIGTRDDFYSYLSGKVAKAAVYSSVLTATQIANHYAAA